LVLALFGRETFYRAKVAITPDVDRANAEHRRAALGYLFWPAALYEHYVEREPASSWYRLQVRQALRFGVRSTAVAIGALLWPLIGSLLIGNVAFTLVMYALAIVLDCVLFVIWLRHAVRYSKRAARGETFDLEPLRIATTRKAAVRE